jgi:hypothetical protein
MVRRCLSVVALLAVVGSVHADVVTDWNNIAQQAIRVNGANPGSSSRELAMVHAAIYDSIVAIDQDYQPIVVHASAAAGTSREAAAAAAAYNTLSTLYPAQQATFLAAYNAQINAIAPGASRDAGIALGAQVAQGVIANRANDGSSAVVSYTPTNAVGHWQPTGPAYAPAWGPEWRYVNTWTGLNVNSVQPPPPPAVNSAAYAAAYEEVRQYGSAMNSLRTTDQTNMAIFWANDRDGTSKPPGQWNQIAQVLSNQQGLNLSQNARLFAMINVAMADAAIAGWETKYRYDYWRPVTGIHQGDSDGNDATTGDVNWQPLATVLGGPVTPPFPAYISGHATFGAAAAEIMRNFFGTDDIAFTCITDEDPTMTRSFTSLSQAAYENAISRVYLGVHWRFDSIEGLSEGTQVGQWVWSTAFQAVPAPGAAALLGLGGVAMLRRRRA